MEEPGEQTRVDVSDVVPARHVLDAEKEPDQATDQTKVGNLITLTWNTSAPFVMPGRTAIVGATSTDFDEVEATMAGALDADDDVDLATGAAAPPPPPAPPKVDRRKFLVGGGVVAAGALGAVVISSIRSNSGGGGGASSATGPRRGR